MARHCSIGALLSRKPESIVPSIDVLPRHGEMRDLPIVLLVSVTLAAAGSPVHAGKLIPVVPVSGSDTNSTVAFGINDSNIIAGSYLDSTGEHGFFGTLAGNYTTFDYLTGGTEPRAINNKGYITGFSNSDGGECKLVEFERSPNGQIVTIMNNGTPLNDNVQGIENRKNKFVGDHCGSGGATDVHAYEGKSGSYLFDLTVSISTQGRTHARGINNSGVIVGYFYGSDGNNHGFLLSGGVATQVDYPGASSTYLEGINDKGTVVVNYVTTSNNFSALLDTNTTTFKSITVPNATFVSAYGVNNGGLVTVTSDVGNYVYCSQPKKDCPSGDLKVTQQ